MDVKITQIGALPAEDGGTDTYYKLEMGAGMGNVHWNNQPLRTYLHDRFTYRSRAPGCMFCNHLAFMPDPFCDTEGVLIVHERLDI